MHSDSETAVSAKEWRRRLQSKKEDESESERTTDRTREKKKKNANDNNAKFFFLLSLLLLLCLEFSRDSERFILVSGWKIVLCVCICGQQNGAAD